MKKYIITCALLCIVILSSAFLSNNSMQSYEEPGKPASDVFKMMEIVYLWELLSADYAPSKERDGTWLLEGFRSKYAMAKKYASLELLEAAFGCPVFIRGPHTEGFNFSSETSFGYYNPEFITRLDKAFDKGMENSLFAAALQKLYEKEFRDMGMIYDDAYLYMNSGDESSIDMDSLKKAYLLAISSPDGTTEGSMDHVFNKEKIMKEMKSVNISDGDDERQRQTRYNDYDALTAPAFWLRRSIDGTDKQIHDLMRKIRGQMAMRE